MRGILCYLGVYATVRQSVSLPRPSPPPSQIATSYTCSHTRMLVARAWCCIGRGRRWPHAATVYIQCIYGIV